MPVEKWVERRRILHRTTKRRKVKPRTHLCMSAEAGEKHGHGHVTFHGRTKLKVLHISPYKYLVCYSQPEHLCVWLIHSFRIHKSLRRIETAAKVTFKSYFKGYQRNKYLQVPKTQTKITKNCFKFLLGRFDALSRLINFTWGWKDGRRHLPNVG